MPRRSRSSKFINDFILHVYQCLAEEKRAGSLRYSVDRLLERVILYTGCSSSKLTKLLAANPEIRDNHNASLAEKKEAAKLKAIKDRIDLTSGPKLEWNDPIFEEPMATCSEEANKPIIPKRHKESTPTPTKIPSRSSVRQKEKRANESFEINVPLKKRKVNTDTPKRRRVGKPSKLDSFEVAAVRNLIYDMFDRKMHFSVKTLNKEIKVRGIAAIADCTLKNYLKKMGFSYKRRGGRAYVMERPYVVACRHKYLREIKKARAEGKVIIFLDETWCNANHQHSRGWQDEEGRSSDKGLGKGGRWIVVDAGGEEGFVKDGNLIFRSNTTNDYHEEMNGERFEKWLTEQLIVNIPAGAVIVMDNAPYHTVCTEDSKTPNTSWKKGDIQEWLQSKGINYEENFIKAELLMICKSNKLDKVYRADQLLKEAGHSVIRLPPYHCELNPIELIWAFEKGYVADQNSAPNMVNAKRLFLEAREHATKDVVNGLTLWQRCCQHVKEEEAKFWARDGIFEMPIHSVTINLDSDSSDEDSDVDSDDADDMDGGHVEPINDYCLMCDIGEGSDDEWVGCDRQSCGAWFHKACLSPDLLEEAVVSLKNKN